MFECPAQSTAEPVADIDLAIDKVLMFRLERMDDGAVWIRLYREGGEDKVIWLNSSSAIIARVEDDKAEAALAQSDAGPKQDVRKLISELRELGELYATDEISDAYPGVGELMLQAAAALAQSNAGPVAWEYRYRFENGSVGDWNPLTEKFIANIFGKSGFDVRIAPPRPDTSAGLIEALNAVFSWARQRCPCENDMPAICPLCDADVTKDVCKAVPGTFPPRLLKQMQDALHAADRSGADASAGLIEAAQSVQEIAYDFARDISTNCGNDAQAIATLIERAIFRARATDRSEE